MAIGTGLVRGTSRGLAREQEWKFRDHERNMSREESQLDQLIGQINTNQQMKYRKERDTVADDNWAKTHGLRVDANTRAEAVETRARDWDTKRKEAYPTEQERLKDRHDWLRKQESRSEETFDQQTETNEYNIGRRPFREEAEKKARDWATAQEARNVDIHEQRKEATDYSKAQRTKQESVTDMTIEEMELRLGELKRQNTDKAIQEAAELRGLLRTKTQSEIDVNNARAGALNFPTGTPRTLKPPTVEQAKTIGKNYHAVRSIVKEGKNLPYQSDTGSSQFSVMGEAGFFNGARLKELIPVGVTRSEVNNIFEGVYQGLMEQVIENPKKEGEYTTLSNQLLRGANIEEHQVRMNSLHKEFMRQMWGGFIKGAPTKTGDDFLNTKMREGYSFEEEIGLPFDHKEGGRANQGFWGAVTGKGSEGPGDMHLRDIAFGGKSSAQFGTEEFVAQQFGKDIDPDRYVNKRNFKDYFFDTRTIAKERFTPFQLGQWIDTSVDQYTDTGLIDWHSFSVLPDYKKANLYSKLPEEKQPQFKIDWESFIQSEQKDQILYRQDPGK